MWLSIIILSALFKPWDLLCHHSHKICKQVCYCEKKKHWFASFNLKSVDEIFSMETQSSTALSCGTVLIIMLHKMFFDWNPGVWPFKWKLLSYFPVVLIIVLCTVAVLFESVGEISKCNHLHESFCEALSWGIVYHS